MRFAGCGISGDDYELDYSMSVIDCEGNDRIQRTGIVLLLWLMFLEGQRMRLKFVVGFGSLEITSLPYCRIGRPDKFDHSWLTSISDELAFS